MSPTLWFFPWLLLMCLQTVLVERPSASDFESATLCWTLFEPSETPLLCGVFSLPEIPVLPISPLDEWRAASSRDLSFRLKQVATTDNASFAGDAGIHRRGIHGRRKNGRESDFWNVLAEGEGQNKSFSILETRFSLRNVRLPLRAAR